MEAIVSVIIPNYNTAHYVVDAIDSVLKSTYKNFEIIIVDDGSEDNTVEVITPYLALPNFKFIQQKNKGLSAARNTGIKTATGKYLVFLDSDDIILPAKLENQVVLLENYPEFDAVYSTSIYFKDKDPGNKISTCFPDYSGRILNHLLFGNFIHVNAIMVRRKVVVIASLFDEQLKELEDWDLWLRLSASGSLFYHQEKILSEVRLRKGSMTTDQTKMNKTMVEVLEKNFESIIASRYRDDKTMFYAYKALLQFKLLASQKKGFNSHLRTSLKKIGLSFLPTATKLFIKRYLINFLPFKNATITKLENVWNE